MVMKTKYITTAIPYVNGAPHIGHALDYLLADVYARFLRRQGETVRFQVGTDEHGGKIANKALELGLPVQQYVDENAKHFKDFINKLGVEYTDFVRTTDPKHVELCQQIWQRLAPHIYKGNYTGWYCSGCERFVAQNEYEDTNGVCPDHNKPYEKLTEENYYLRIADFKSAIKEAIETDRMQILPVFRKNEILNLLDEAPDVSISRPRTQLEWGIEVPDDKTQVMYVWIDALANYLTVLGYPEQEIGDYWPAKVQIVGKDILRFHAIIWPAILLGLGLELPETILSHGHILNDGQKMSKSLGNVVNPLEVLEKHGLDPFRYYFTRHIDTFTDSSFTWEKFEEAYNNELANDWGNLIQRLATIAQKNHLSLTNYHAIYAKTYLELMQNFQFAKALDYIWGRIQNLNQTIDQEKPWQLAKEQKTAQLTKVMTKLMTELLNLNAMLAPFLPTTAQKIENIFIGSEILPPETPLFPKA